MKKIFASGYYGRLNLGDDVLLLNFLLDKKSDDTLFIIPSFSPDITKEQYKEFNIKVVNYYNILTLLKEMVTSNCIAFPGGGHLFDNKKLCILTIITFAIIKLWQKETIMYPIGVEPIHTVMGKIAARLLVKANKGVLVRDIYSKNELTKIGIQESAIKCTIDPAINIFNHIDIKKKHNLTDNKKLKIAISFLDANKSSAYKDKEKLYIQIINFLLKKGHQLYLVPMCYGEGDYVLMKELKNNYIKNDKISIIENVTSPLQMIERIGDFDACIGMRLHFKIFAALNGIPFSSITRSNKSRAICEYFEQKEIGNINDSFVIMENNLNEFLDNIKEYQKRVQDNLQKALNLNDKTYSILNILNCTPKLDKIC